MVHRTDNQPAEAAGPKMDEGSSLTVLVIGQSEVWHVSGEILHCLILLGYGIRLLGVIDLSQGDGNDLVDEHSGEFSVDKLRTLFQAEPPDLVIVTSDEQRLRQNIAGMLPAPSRFMDAFSIDLIQSMRQTYSPAASRPAGMDHAEIMKEALISGPETWTMVVDEDLTVLDIDDNLVERTGLRKTDCINAPCYRVLRGLPDPCFNEGEICVAWQVLRTGRSAHTIREDYITEEASRFYTISGYPMRNEDVERRSVLLVWKDVTEGIKPVLDRRTEDIKESFSYVLRHDKMVALGKLAAAAVHEINNPVQGILTFAKLIKQSLNKETYSPEELDRFRRYLDLIADESARCGKILKNLLSFAKKGEMDKNAVDMRAVVDETYMLIRNRLHLQGVSFETSFAEDLPLIEADRDQMKQVVLNIIMNAMEAMPNGGAIKLEGNRDHAEDQIILTISDTGPGIPKEALTKIFEPFYTTKHKTKGVGLGLSVVYGIVTQHGGDIEISGEPGQGAVFTISLPAHRKTREE